jgi:hypothetical protein
MIRIISGLLGSLRLAALAIGLALAAALPAAADTRTVYTVVGIPVDERAATTIAAQENAFAAARLIATRELIDRITLAEDRGAAGGVPVDLELANRLSAAVDIVEESRGGGRYRGKLTVVMNPRLVREHLVSLGVPYIDEQAPSAVILLAPESAFAAAQTGDNPGGLAPYRLVVNAIANDANADFWALAQGSGAQRLLVAREIRESGQLRVALSLATPNGLEPFATTNLVASADGLGGAVAQALDETWKRQAIVRAGERTNVQAVVRYTSLTEWVTLREALSRSPVVSEFRTLAVARDGALVRFAYAGSVERLNSDLVQRGVALNPDAGGWELRSAGAAVRSGR